MMHGNLVIMLAILIINYYLFSLIIFLNKLIKNYSKHKMNVNKQLNSTLEFETSYSMIDIASLICNKELNVYSLVIYSDIKNSDPVEDIISIFNDKNKLFKRIIETAPITYRNRAKAGFYEMHSDSITFIFELRQRTGYKISTMECRIFGIDKNDEELNNFIKKYGIVMFDHDYDAQEYIDDFEYLE